MRLWLSACWLTAALFAVAGFVGTRAHRQGMQTVGRDSAPSIISAERVKAELAAMHAAAARELLESPERRPAAEKEFLERRRGLTEALLSATANITYGDSERIPIRTMLDGLGTYEGALAQARLLHARGDAGFVEPLRRADAVLTDTLLPAADALDRANQEVLDAGYTRARRADLWAWLWLALSGLAALGALIGTQLLLARKTRRLVNPPLVTATGAVVFGFVALASAYVAAGHELHRAKEDCFHSIDVLEKARADGYKMLAAHRIFLLDPARADVYTARFRDRRDKILTPAAGETIDVLVAKVSAQKLPPGVERSSDAEAVSRAWGELARKDLPESVSGHLAFELRNITFVGERDAAVEALRGFGAFISAEARVSELTAGGKRSEAIALALADRPGSAARSFREFDNALGRTLDINHTEFDLAVNRGSAATAEKEWLAIGLAAGVCLLALLGLRPRLREYAG
jgi:hypothetical protein